MTPEDADLCARLQDWRWLAEYANGGWEMPPAATAALERMTKQAAARIEALAGENEQWKTWGIVEIAIRNPNVSSYVKEWEGRAERAEADNAALRKAIGNALYSLSGYAPLEFNSAAAILQNAALAECERLRKDAEIAVSMESGIKDSRIGVGEVNREIEP